MTFLDEKCLPNKLSFLESKLSAGTFFFLVSIESFSKVFLMRIDYKFFEEFISVGFDKIT